MASDDTDDLRDRVEQLEATVEQQQATIQQLLPSRRRVLQAGGLVAGGGVLGALTADRAAADVVGQVGTQQDRVDVFAGAVDANSVNTGGNRFVETGDTFITPTWGPSGQRSFSTSSQNYENLTTWFLVPSVQWDIIVPDAAQGVIYTHVNPTSTMDVRLQNVTDGETVFEQTGSSGRVQTTVEYTPTTTSDSINLFWEIRSPDGSSVEAVDPWASIGRQL
jgi:hypothetical protein